MPAGPCDCGGLRKPTYEEIQAEAMRFWRAREMLFPAFTRRMEPDELDYQSGVWGLMFAEAHRRLSAEIPAPATPHDGEAL